MDDFENQYKKKNPFSVPEEYFDHLTNRVMEQVDAKAKPRKSNFLQMAKPYLGLVAIFALVMFIVQVVLPGGGDKNRMLMKENGQIVEMLESSVDDLSLDSHFEATSEEIIEYLASEVDTYELIYAEIY